MVVPMTVRPRTKRLITICHRARGHDVLILWTIMLHSLMYPRHERPSSSISKLRSARNTQTMIATSNEITTHETTHTIHPILEHHEAPRIPGLTLYYGISLRTFVQSIASSFFSSCIHNIPPRSLSMRASIRHCFDMTRLLSSFTSRDGDTLFCLSFFAILFFTPSPLPFWEVFLLVCGSRAMRATKQGSDKIT